MPILDRTAAVEPRRTLAVRDSLARVTELLEAHPVLLALACIVPLIAKALWTVSGKLPWFDELFVLPIAKLSLGESWRVLLQGADNQPPLIYWLPHFSLKIWSETGLGLRVWSVAGMTMMVTVLYVIVGRRLGWVYGALAVFVARLSEVEAFTWEGGRQYALVSGSVALATLGWLSAGKAGRARGRWALVCFGLGLGLAGGLHYFAILAFFPFFAGQLMRDWERRRLDLPVWFAMGLAAIPWAAQIVPMYPAVSKFSAHFWEPGSAARIVHEFYRILDNALLLLFPFFFAWFGLHSRRGPDRESPFSIPDRVCISLLAAAPMWVYPILSRSGAYGNRYVLYSVAGWAILIPLLFWFADRGTKAMTTVAVLFMLPLLAFTSLRAAFREPLQPRMGPDIAAMREWEPNRPIVVPQPMRYVEAYYYSPDDLKARLYHPVDRKRSIAFNGRDTGVLALEGIGPLLEIKTPAYDEFFRTHDEVLIWQQKEQEYKSWLMASLIKEGWSIQWRKEWPHTEVYLARRSAR